MSWVVVVAQLVERSLPIPEVHGSNPVLDKICIENLFTVNCIEKTKIRKKETGNGSFCEKNDYVIESCKGTHDL